MLDCCCCSITGEGEQKIKNCTASCPNKWNLACAFANRCWSSIGSFVGLFVGLAAGFGLLVLAAKFGWISSLLQMCGAGASSLCGSCGGSSNSSNARDGKKEQQQQSKRNSTASKGGDSRSGNKKKKQKGRNHRGSRSSIDSTDSRSSSRGSYEDDQRFPKAAAKESKAAKGKGGSTSRRPSAAAAAAATAAAAAAGGRQRSRQTSALTSPNANSHAVYSEFEESRQPWGSGAGDNEGFEGSGRPQRPYSSSGGGKKVSSRMQPPQPWDDSATGGYSRPSRPSSTAPEFGGKPLKWQPSGAPAAPGGSSGGARVGRQVRSSSVERGYAGDGYEGQGAREFASAYGSSQQPVKQGGERRSGRTSAGQSSTGEIQA